MGSPTKNCLSRTFVSRLPGIGRAQARCVAQACIVAIDGAFCSTYNQYLCHCSEIFDLCARSAHKIKDFRTMARMLITTVPKFWERKVQG